MNRLYRISAFSCVALAAMVVALSVGNHSAWADGGANHQIHQNRPIPLGISGINREDFCFVRGGNFVVCGTGTLGSLVEDGGGTQYILSNNHIFGELNQATPGDDVIQPGYLDDCFNQDPSANVVADLSEFVTLVFGGADNLVDAGIAEIRAGAVDTSGTILDIGTIATTTAAPFVGQAVKKSGRTTGLTNGTVNAISVTVNVGYLACGAKQNEGQTGHFVDQIEITPGSFIAGGDSGSLMVDSTTNQAVGLLFAGSSFSAIANKIDNVLCAFSTPLAMAGGTPSCPGGLPAVCGDGTCDANEDTCNCAADCGTPPAAETSCSNGTDDDCDGAVDCDDADCTGDPACPSCGDGTCDPGEDSCNCASDCGTPPSSETSCNDGADNDCDGSTDCADSDCVDDAACQTGTVAIVDCVTYDKNVTIDILIVDDLGNPVAGALVTPEVFVNGSSIGDATGTTDGSGVAGFRLRGTRNGDCIETDVGIVDAAGLTFDNSTPANGYLKGTDSKPDSDCRAGSDLCGAGASNRAPGANVQLVAVPRSGANMSVAEVSAINRRNSDRLFGIADVVGHGVTLTDAGAPAIVVYLAKENAASRAQIRATLNGVPVKVKVTGPFTAYQACP